MRNNVGIMNSRAFINGYARDLKRRAIALPAWVGPVTREEVERWKTLTRVKYDLAVFHRCDVQIRERERQLQLLGEWRPA